MKRPVIITKDKRKRLKSVCFDTYEGASRAWGIRYDGSFTANITATWTELNLLESYLSISPNWVITGSVVLPATISVFYDRKEKQNVRII